MVCTPIVLLVAERITRLRLRERHVVPEPSGAAPASNPVIIAGFGRYGQVIDRVLASNRIQSTVIDHDPAQIELLRRFGHQVLYGDATRIDLLRAAGADQARLLIVALDDADATTRLVDLARKHFPALQLLVRVRNRTQAYEMLERGIQDFERETFPAALNTAVKALLKLGFDRQKASEAARLFHRHDEENPARAASDPSRPGEAHHHERTGAAGPRATDERGNGGAGWRAGEIAQGITAAAG
jgi:glutathione-regulated potassium-efflux system ancillary protein KefC